MTLSSSTARSPLAIVAKRHGISQNEIARRTGLAYHSVNDAWHGRPSVTLSTWVKIAKAVGVPLALISPLAASELDGLVVNS